MSATARALRLVRRLEEDDAWTLLRADNAPFAIALLAEHLGGGEHRVDADQLAEAIDTDLEEIRSYGHDMPLSARGYLTSWRTAGLIHRRPSEVSRGETYELTVDALAAIRFLQTREEPQEAATASRLASLSMQLTRLAIDTDPESARRLERLRAERDRIDAQIQAVLDGEEEVLGGARALERLRELLAQAAEVPDDFTRVRGVFEELSSTLRAKVLESDASQRSVLDDVFRGVDHIGDSDAGRSFAAFSALVLDPALGAAFERDIADVLDREFARDLAPAQRRRLRGFLDDLKDRTAEVHDVITVFARGLRRYVQSQDYQRDRVLRGKLLAAMGAAHRAAPDIKPYAAIGLNLELTGAGAAGAGARPLPARAGSAAGAGGAPHPPRAGAIERRRARAGEPGADSPDRAPSANEAPRANRPPPGGAVPAASPATQGVASVVGLLSLAAEHGAMEDGVEQISWTSADDVRSTALVTTHRFTGRIP